MGHEDLCKHVINDLNMYGLSVIDDFLGRHKGLEILNEVHHMYTAGVFKVSKLTMLCVSIVVFCVKKTHLMKIY